MVVRTDLTALEAAKRRKARLRIEDPYDQPGLVTDIPPGAELVEVLNKYRLEQARWDSGEKVWCARCRKKLHQHGFTALVDTKDKVLLGSKCGAKVFGAKWSNHVNEYQDDLRDVNFEIWLHEVRLPELRQALEILPRFGPGLKVLAATQLHFEQQLGLLYQRLYESVSRDNGRLLVYTLIDGVLGKRNEAHQVHNVAGAAFFQRIDPVAVLQKARSATAEFIELSEKPRDVIKLRDIRAQNGLLDGRYKRLRRVIAMWDAALAFFSPANLGPVVKWANETPFAGGHYRLDVRRIVSIESGRCAEIRGHLPPLDRGLVARLPTSDATLNEDRRVAI